jgi:hypothetical protein
VTAEAKKVDRDNLIRVKDYGYTLEIDVDDLWHSIYVWNK